MVLQGSTHAPPKNTNLSDKLLNEYKQIKEDLLSSSQAIDEIKSLIDQLSVRKESSLTVINGIPPEKQLNNPLYVYHVNALQKLEAEIVVQKKKHEKESAKQKEAQALIPEINKKLIYALKEADGTILNYDESLAIWQKSLDKNQKNIDDHENIIHSNRKSYEALQEAKEIQDQSLMLENSKRVSRMREQLTAKEQQEATKRDITDYRETIKAKTEVLSTLQKQYNDATKELEEKEEEQGINAAKVSEMQSKVKTTDTSYKAKLAEKAQQQQSGKWANLTQEQQTAVDEEINSLKADLEGSEKQLTEFQTIWVDITNELVKLTVIKEQFPPTIEEANVILSETKGKNEESDLKQKEVAKKLTSLENVLKVHDESIDKLNKVLVKSVDELEKVAKEFVVLKAKFEVALQIQEKARNTINLYNDQQRKIKMKTEIFSNAKTSIDSRADGLSKVSEDMNDVYFRTHASKGIIKVAQLMLESYAATSYSRDKFFEYSGFTKDGALYGVSTNYKYTGKVDADVIEMLQEHDEIKEYVALSAGPVKFVPDQTSEGWYRAADNVKTKERIRLTKKGTPREQIAKVKQWGMEHWQAWHSGTKLKAGAKLIAVVGPTGIIGTDVMNTWRGNWRKMFPNRADLGKDKSGKTWSWWSKDSVDPYKGETDDSWEVTYGVFDTCPQTTNQKQVRANNILGTTGMSYLASAMPNIGRPAIIESKKNAKKAVRDKMYKHPVYAKSWAKSTVFRKTVYKAIDEYFNLKLKRTRAETKAYTISRYAASMIAHEGDTEMSLKVIKDIKQGFEQFHAEAGAFWIEWMDERDHIVSVLDELEAPSKKLGLSEEEYKIAKETYIKQINRLVAEYGKNIIAEGLAVQEAAADRIYAKVQTIYFNFMAENANNDDAELEFKQLEAEKFRQIDRMLKAKDQLVLNRKQIESRVESLQEALEKAAADEKTRAKFYLEYAQSRLTWFEDVEKVLDDTRKKIDDTFERNVAAAYRQTVEVYGKLKTLADLVNGESNKNVRESMIDKAVVAARKNMENEKEERRTIDNWAAELANGLTTIIDSIKIEQDAARRGTLGDAAKKLKAYKSVADLKTALGSKPTLKYIDGLNLHSSTNVLVELHQFAVENKVAEVAAQDPQGGLLDKFGYNDDETTQKTIFMMVDLVFAIEEMGGKAGGLYRKVDSRFRPKDGDGEAETLTEMAFEKIEGIAENHRAKLAIVKQEANKKIEETKTRIIETHNQNIKAVNKFRDDEIARESNRYKTLNAYQKSLSAKEEIQRKQAVTKLTGEFALKRAQIVKKLNESVGDYMSRWQGYFADQTLYNKNIKKKLRDIKVRILRQKQEGKPVNDEVLAAFDAKEIKVADRFDQVGTISPKDLYTKQRVDDIYTALAKVLATLDQEGDLNQVIVNNLTQIIGEQQRQTVALEAKRTAQFKSYTDQIIVELDEEIGEEITADESTLQMALVAIAKDHHDLVNDVQAKAYKKKISLITKESAKRVQAMSNMKSRVFAEISTIQDLVQQTADGSMGFNDVLEINSLVKNNYALSRIEAERSFEVSSSIRVENTFADVYDLQKKETFNRIKTVTNWEADEDRYTLEFKSRLNHAVAGGVGDGYDDLVGDYTDMDVKQINRDAYANAVGYYGFPEGLTAAVTHGDNWLGTFTGGTTSYNDTIYAYDAEELAQTVSIYETKIKSYLDAAEKEAA